MDNASDRRSDEAGKTGANLQESLKEEGGVVVPNLDLVVEEVNPGEQTIEGLLEENKKLKATVEEQREDIRKFQERQITSLELADLAEALKITVKELGDRLKRIERTEILDRASHGQDEVKLAKVELTELWRLEKELEMTVEQLKMSIGPVADGRERIGTKLVEIDRGPSVFGIFPEEVWEQILGELEDSKDILNVFKAFPDLDGRVLKNKYWWLFDQVVPHLRGWINNEELLSCRLVCKKWAHGVENHLENLPLLNVVEHGRPITGQVWYPEGSRAYADYTRRAWDTRGCEVWFPRHTSQITKFLRNVDTHPPTRNPFLMRSVNFDIPGAGRKRVTYLNAAMEILQKYGRHVWFLSVDGRGDDVCQIVLDFIYFVPNLKTLELDGIILDDHESNAFEGWDRGVFFSRLSKLKSLNLHTMSIYESSLLGRFFMDSLVTRFSAQIQKLSIRQSAWVREYGELFPNLRELRLNGDFYQDKIVDILTSLNVPNLTKLWVDVVVFGFRRSLNLADILSWVKRFPSLQHLGVIVTKKDYYTAGRVDGPRVFECVPSIKSVSISWKDVHRLGVSFLGCFPSLEYASMSDKYDEYSEKWLVNKNVYRWGLWEELPSLKEISLHTNGSLGLPIHCNRTTYYELMKKKGEERNPFLRREKAQDGIEGFQSVASVTLGDEQNASAEAKEFDSEDEW